MGAEAAEPQEVERVYARARALCREVGDTPQLLPVLWGLWAFYEVRGELQTGLELAEQFATLAQRFRLRLVPGHPVEPWPLISLRPRFGMRMVIESRAVVARAG